jgi:hypothetical protein
MIEKNNVLSNRITLWKHSFNFAHKQIWKFLKLSDNYYLHIYTRHFIELENNSVLNAMFPTCFLAALLIFSHVGFS